MTRRIIECDIDVDDIFMAYPREKFYVNDLVDDEQGTWVHYTRLRDKTTYNCLKEAFLQRFTRVVE